MSNPPEHIVYLSCREILTNTHTQIRQPKVILRSLESCPGAERQAIEAETTKPETAAVKFAAIEDESESNAIKERNAAEDNPSGTGSNAMATNFVTETTLIPSLYPIYLPYKTQHQIFSKMQFILEECCFNFATTSLPEATSARGWEYPEAAELTQWIKLLLPREEEVSANAVSKIPGRSWQELLIAASKIRHSAVHRLHSSAKGIQNMLGDAIMLTIMLKDTIRTSLLEHISRELASSIEEVEGRLVILEIDLIKKLDMIAKWRAEFGRIQDAVIYRAMNNDRENRRVIGLALGEELKELCSVEETIPDKYIVNTNGIKAELSEEVTSAMSRPAKQMLNPDLCGESKGENGIK